MNLGLSAASQKIASLVATASQAAQIQTRAINPVTLVRSLQGAQQVVVTTSGDSDSSSQQQPIALLPQSVQLVHQPVSLNSGHSGGPGALQQALSSQTGGQQVHLIQQQVIQQPVIIHHQQKPEQPFVSQQPQLTQPSQAGDNWNGGGETKPSVHLLVRFLFDLFALDCLAFTALGSIVVI